MSLPPREDIPHIEFRLGGYHLSTQPTPAPVHGRVEAWSMTARPGYLVHY